MNRRVFLKSGAMAMLALGFAPSFLGRAAAAVGARRKLLIAIFQRGAVDGLNMIVPYGEADYYRLRPTSPLPRPGSTPMGSAIDLDGFFGLHPSMAPLKPLWDNHSLAIVHACGSPDNTRSHFDGQDYMESATPGVKATRDGWLNRYLQVSSAERNPLRGVALARTMPRSLEGPAPSPPPRPAAWRVGVLLGCVAPLSPSRRRTSSRRITRSAPPATTPSRRCARCSRRRACRIAPPRACSIRIPPSARRSAKSRGLPRPTSASRSRSPNWATGTIT